MVSGKKKIMSCFQKHLNIFLGSVGKFFFFILRIFFTLEKHENHSKYPNNTEKNLKCLKNFLGRPQKSRVGGVSGNETFFFGLNVCFKSIQIYI